MGLFRLLSPSRPENSKSSDSSSTSNPSSSSSSSPSDRPNLLIHLPTEGLIFFQPPEDAQVHALEHGIQTSYDQLVNGELEIRLPTGSEPRWCKAIRVGVRTTSKLNMGPDRMGEEDILFERMVEITDEGDQGVVLLIEGSQSFKFTLILPSTLPPHAMHDNGIIVHIIYAEIIGADSDLEDEGRMLRIKAWNASNASRQRRPSQSSPRSQSTLWEEYRRTSTAPSETIMVLTKSASSSIAGIPEKDVPGARAFNGSYFTAMRLRSVFHPDPNEGARSLDISRTNLAPGVGLYDLKILSDIWSVAAPIQATLNLPELDAALTIFALRMTLHQTHSIASPRDDPEMSRPLVSTVRLPVGGKGQRPPIHHTHPSIDQEALWRGKSAGGVDNGGLRVEVWGRIPTDGVVRASTLSWMKTPITIKHTLATEVFFSIYGQDEMGKPMVRHGAGGLQVLRFDEPVFLPACTNIPAVIELPTYDTAERTVEKPKVSYNNKHGWEHCACELETDVVHERLRFYIRNRQEIETAQTATQASKVGVPDRAR